MTMPRPEAGVVTPFTAGSLRSQHIRASPLSVYLSSFFAGKWPANARARHLDWRLGAGPAGRLFTIIHTVVVFERSAFIDRLWHLL